LFQYIDDLWIMNSSGIVIFKQTQSEMVDASLFGGLMSAINSFATKVANSSLDSIILQDYRYFVLKEGNVSFIASTKKDIKQEKAKEEIKKIVEIFFNEYDPQKISKWDGNIHFFDDFEKNLEKEFLVALKTFEN